MKTCLFSFVLSKKPEQKISIMRFSFYVTFSSHICYGCSSSTLPFIHFSLPNFIKIITNRYQNLNYPTATEILRNLSLPVWLKLLKRIQYRITKYLRRKDILLDFHLLSSFNLNHQEKKQNTRITYLILRINKTCFNVDN